VDAINYPLKVVMRHPSTGRLYSMSVSHQTKLLVCNCRDRCAPIIDSFLEFICSLALGGLLARNSVNPGATSEVAFHGLRVRQGRCQRPSAIRLSSIHDLLVFASVRLSE